VFPSAVLARRELDDLEERAARVRQGCDAVEGRVVDAVHRLAAVLGGDGHSFVGVGRTDCASAAPLAGVWRVADASRRQLPGNARAADPWSARGDELPLTCGGCGLAICQ